MSALSLLLFIFLVGCAGTNGTPAGTPSPPPVPTTTPEIGVTLETRAPPTAAVVQTTPSPLPSATPTPSATPIIYLVEEGDTLLGIALQNYTTVDEIEALNPGVMPELLQIGQPLQLPPPATPIFQGGAGTPIPLQVAVRDVSLYRTPLGGLWLLGEVVNEGQYPAGNVQLEISLRGEDGAELGRVPAWVVPAVVPAGAAAPFGVLVEDPPAGDVQPAVAIVGGETLADLGTRYLDLAVTAEDVAIEESRVMIEGSVQNVGDRTAAPVVVVATFYDAQGRVSGYAQVLLEGSLPAGDTWPYTLNVTPPGGQTVRYSLLAQGLIQQD